MFADSAGVGLIVYVVVLPLLMSDFCVDGMLPHPELAVFHSTRYPVAPVTAVQSTWIFTPSTASLRPVAAAIASSSVIVSDGAVPTLTHGSFDVEVTLTLLLDALAGQVAVPHR